MKGRPINYSADELAWIETHKCGVRRKTHADFCERFGRQDVTFINLNSLCKRKGWLTGRTGCYEPGRTPENKGKKMPFNANSAKTQFKTGQLPHNTKHLGHERVSKDGYVEISINEINPHTGYERHYVHKHRHLWELANGPVPDGMCLKCLDSNKANTDPSNWEAIPRAMLPRLNGRHSLAYDDAVPELKPTIIAIAKLEQKMREAKKGTA